MVNRNNNVFVVTIPVRGIPETLPLDGEIDRTVGGSLGPEFQICSNYWYVVIQNF